MVHFRACASVENSMLCKIPTSVPANHDVQRRFCIITVNSGYANYSFMLYTTVEEGYIAKLVTCEYSFETNAFCHSSAKFTCQ